MKVVVVSPHLDDAVMSLGATMHHLSRRGHAVRLVTLFAGDPASPGRASHWDARRSPDAATAAAQRREEDAGAAADLGVEPVWMPFDDAAYMTARDPDVLWDALRPQIGTPAMVLVPGWPLDHPDHRYTTMLVTSRLDPAIPARFYCELPYAAVPAKLARAILRGRKSSVVTHAIGDELEWRHLQLATTDWAAKRRGVERYRSELDAMGRRAVFGLLHDRVVRREWIGRPRGQEELPWLDVRP